MFEELVSLKSQLKPQKIIFSLTYAIGGITVHKKNMFSFKKYLEITYFGYHLQKYFVSDISNTLLKSIL